jgi:hypothetical protein
MNKRDAKRFAYDRAALILQSTIESGYTPTGPDGQEIDEEHKDYERVIDAFREIIQQLERKSDRLTNPR